MPTQFQQKPQVLKMNQVLEFPQNIVNPKSKDVTLLIHKAPTQDLQENQQEWRRFL